MMKKTPAAAVAALGLGVVLAAAACSSGGSGSTGGGTSSSTGGASSSTTGSGNSNPVSLTFWNNATPGPGLTYYQNAVRQFEAAHPNVTIKMQNIQNEDYDGKLQTALNSNTAPDIFFQRGGGKMQAMVNANQLQTLNLSATDKTNLGGAGNVDSINSTVYGIPLDANPEGVYYSQDLFTKAKITSTPTTIPELEADIAKLKAAGITPVVVGGKDGWPAAHWYYNFALRECSQATMNTAGQSLKFTDSCWTKAGNDLQSFLKVNPFQPGFLTTAAQVGAGSSAGLLANHKAAMELMGAWEPGTVASLTPNQKPLPDLRWFPFPSVPGGAGDPSAMMGGFDGFSLSKNAPAEAWQFLEFLLTTPQQEAYAKAFVTIPVNPAAQGVVTDPSAVEVKNSLNKAGYTMQFLDTQYGQNVGNALNAAVVNLLAGKGTPADIVSSTSEAAAKG
ncbi:extracellular solute-binding protein [Trebonia kvetii]|uniref:Extracellular solute-binding protein n=1 Tax=Trebonia kvetii TaxID=2480626 RepID=A0A6P2C1T5_9ACTN|nr:extracellular solute-binding protein [Trebonia kvetii]TVZ04436.1 extracellular solute-binding protein [Trebonia kvetii]